jgi:KaiC/GvpD/RAD55 family RecA-like ATPase
LIKLNKLSIIDLWNISDRLGLNAERYTAEDANILFEVIRDITKELGAKRLVVDSITSLCYRLETNEMIRDFIFRLGTSLAAMNCTTILTSEIPPCVLKYSQYGIEEFIADGIIFLEDVERNGNLIRTLQVIKMRGTAHNRTKFVLSLSSKNGVELAPMLKSNVEFKRLDASPSLFFGETSEEEID